MAEVGSAYVSLLPSARNFGSNMQRQVGPQIDSTAKKTGSRFGRIFAYSTMGPLRALGGAALGFFAFNSLKNAISGAVDEAREAQVVGARTQNVIKSMGLASEVTAKQIGDLAGRISNKTAVDDEAIQSGQNLLLTFKNVAASAGETGGIFAQSTRAVVNMAAALGTDMKGAAIQVGKALNDPIKGVTALTRAGVSFTERQKEMITNWVESGRLAKAQGLILGELKNQFGGAAASMATPAERAKVAWANLQEQIGVMLLPIIDRLLRKITAEVIPAVSQFVHQIETGRGAGGRFADQMRGMFEALSSVVSFIIANRAVFVGLATSIGVITVAVKALTVAQALLNVVLVANPIGIIITAVAALVAGYFALRQRSESFRKATDAAAATIRLLITALRIGVGIVVSFGSAVLGRAIPPIIRFGSAVRDFIAGAIRVAVAAIGNMIGWFSRIGGAIGNAIQSFVGFAAGVRRTMADAIGYVAAIPARIKAALSGLYAIGAHAAGELIAGLVSSLTAGLAKVKSKVSEIAGAIKGFFPGSPVKTGPLTVWNDGSPGRYLMELLAKGIESGRFKVVNAALETAKQLRDRFKSMIDQVRADMASLRESISSTFAGNLFDVSAIAETLTDTTHTAAQTVGTAFVNNLLDTQGRLKELLKAFRKLRKWGLSSAFLTQLFASGNSGLILEMASGSQAQAASTASLFGNVQSLANQLGGGVARNEYGDELRKQTNRLERIERAIKKVGPEVARALNDTAAKAQRSAA